MLEKQTKKQGVTRQCPTCKYQEAVPAVVAPEHGNGFAEMPAELTPVLTDDTVELDAVRR